MEGFMNFPSYFYDQTGEDPIYGDVEFIYGDSIGDLVSDEFGQGPKIVELTDTGCDASPSVLGEKKKSVGKVKKNPEKLIATEKIEVQREIRAGGYKLNGYFVNENLLDKSSSTSLVKSSQRHYRTKGKSEANYFETPKNCKNIQDYHQIRDKKIFTDRAVDGDCISDVFSLEEINTSDDSIKLDINNLKINKKDPSEKGVRRNENEKLANKSVGKTKRLSKLDGDSTVAEKGNIQPRSYFQDQQNFAPKSPKTFEAKADPKIISDIPRFVERPSSADTRGNSEVKKKTRFEGSKLPVWRASYKKSCKLERKINQNLIKIDNTRSDDKITNNHKIIVAGKNFSSAEMKIIDGSKIESDIFGKSDKALEEIARIDEYAETSCNGAIGTKIEENTESSENCAVLRGKMEKEINMSGKSSKNKKTSMEDQSQSDLWSENYEEAYVKGRAVGLKIYRMAKAARDERKRKFRNYGFENYNQRPRKKPQEILDIGVELVEKVDRDEN